MKFEKITYTGLTKSVELVEFESLQFVKDRLNERFKSESDVARYEEFKMDNGKTSVSLKDSGNKLIIQFKTA